MSKSLSELVSEHESAWNIIQEWIKEATNHIEILPNSRGEGEKSLLILQIPNKSTMGAIALETGGILIDHGWLRILGSGNSRISRISGNLLSWNCLNGNCTDYTLEGGFIIAYDIIGGFFAINTGGLGSNIKNIYYFAPDTLQWEDTEKGYTDFFRWTLDGNLDLYYKAFRWTGWEKEVSSLDGQDGISVYPYLWTDQSKDVGECHRAAVPMTELWGIHNDFVKQLLRR